MLKRFKRLIAGAFIVCFIIGLIYALRLPPQYEATTMVLVVSERTNSIPNIPGLTTLISGFVTPKSDMPDFETLLNSRRFAVEVAERTGMRKDLEKIQKKSIPDTAIHNIMKGAMEIKSTGSTTLASVGKSRKRRLCADIANTYVEVLQEYLQQHSLTAAARNRRFLEKRLREANGEAAAVENRGQDFLEANEIMAEPKEQITHVMSLYMDLISELTRARVELDSLTTKRDALLRNAKIAGSAKSPISDILNDSTVASIRNKLTDKQVDLADAMLLYQPGNVRIRNIQQDIAGLKRQLAREIQDTTKSQAVSEDIEIIAIGAKIHGLETVIGRFKEKLADSPGKIIQYGRIERDIKIKNEVIGIVAAEYEKARIEESRKDHTLIVLDKAVPPETRTYPRRKLMILFGGLLGLFAGLFAAFFIDFLDRAREMEAARA